MHYDVIILGSGFGGSISANNLARAGLKVLVIERGPWRDSLPIRSFGISARKPFPYGFRILTHGLRSYHSALTPNRGITINKFGMYEMFRFSGIDILCTSNVGGGSHAYAGMLVKPEKENYWKNRHPRLKSGTVERYYPRVLSEMTAHPFKKDEFMKNTAWRRLACMNSSKFQTSKTQPYMAIKFPGVTAEKQSSPYTTGIERESCKFDGDSFLGSRGGAKASVDFIYLVPAIRAGAILRPMCEVRKISKNSEGDSRYSVEFRDLEKKNTEIAHSNNVIFAAGTINTLRILFESSRGLAKINPIPRLGKTFGGNTDLVGLWEKEPLDKDSFDTPPCLGRFTMDHKDAPFLVFGAFPGLDSLPLPNFLKKKLFHKIPVVGMASDSGKGIVSYEGGRIRVEYNMKKETVFKEVRKVFKILEQESGFSISVKRKPATVHPWGGACIGANENLGVVDHNGEIFRNPGLYIADGSALPAAPGTPPTLAIAAWAYHVSNRLAERMSP